MRALRRCFFISTLMLLLASPVIAAPINETLIFRVTAVDPGVTAVAVGDRFTVQFTIEDSVIDTNASTGAGTFPSLVTSFIVTPDPTNSGTWAPTGTFDLGAASNYVTNAFGDGVTLQVRGTGFPDGGAGLTFQDFDLNFGVPFGVTDSGLGDTFAQQLSGGTIDFNAFLFGGGLRFTDGQDFPEATFVIEAPASAPAVPLSGPAGLAAMALLLVAVGFVVLRTR